MVRFTLKLNFVDAACCNVEVINGGFGLIFSGFFDISLIFNGLFLMRDSIFLASSSSSKGSEFFLNKENKMLSLSLFKRFIEIAQNSLGLNS